MGAKAYGKNFSKLIKVVYRNKKLKENIFNKFFTQFFFIF